MSAEPETYQPELLAEEEPKYLRRQKPLEIRRRKFGRRTWKLYKRVALGGAIVAAGGLATYQAWQFFHYSSALMLARAEQIELLGNQYVSRDAVLEKFTADRGRSVLRVPLEERRQSLEEISWVERASVQRILPNHIRVELVERTPVAFVRWGNDLALADAFGVILERPAGERFQFPVIGGISENQGRKECEQRMRLYLQFMKEIEQVRLGAGQRVSEVDLSDAKDLRTVLVGFNSKTGSGASTVLVHFGDGDFRKKYQILVQNFPQWRASAGSLDSVDLRFAGQVVVNPETAAHAAHVERR
ncbi:MAG TPA: FtsQ-type POTRA domain-containing protein [Candidatus Dormibacteraeota bacterium]|nr:FtsQ-type POTRA domain-containing protein [Candidatus Dormibacteraeota bacterium]